MAIETERPDAAGPLLAEPEPPAEWECCGSECGDACIQEIYRREKAAYDEQQKRLAAQAADAQPPA